MTATTRADLIDALRIKLAQLDHMGEHLDYTSRKVSVRFPMLSLAGLNPDELEVLAAFKGRYAEFQDHLAAAMRLVARIEEVNVNAFTYVINYMEKIGVISSAEAWNDARAVRNDAAHAYSDDAAEQAGFFNQVYAKTPFLFETLAALRDFCRRTYPEGN
ncbi:MAG: hypothetical protein WC091_09930 [Sulfuricellaceae bacterium]